MNNELDPIAETTVERKLEELKTVPARDPLKAASGRARFLREATEYQQTISSEAIGRHKRWNFPIRKEKLSMNALVSLILAASLLLGGGVTVAAAQDDLPNQSLYQLKLWTENATLAVHDDPQDQATLLMTMAQTRTQEMAALVEMGVVPPDQVRERLQQHLDQTLRLASGMEDGTRDRYLQQLHDQLQTQDRIMQQLQVHATPGSEALLLKTRKMLQLRLQLVDQGQAEPQGFKQMLENQMRYGQDEGPAPGPNQQGEPGFHKNDENGNAPGMPGGNGKPNGGDSNNSSGDANLDKHQDGNGSSSPNHESPGGPNNENSQGGENGQGGNSPGGDGGNK